MTKRALLVVLLLMTGATTTSAQIPDGVTNSQNPNDTPPSPAESLKKITVPQGFAVSLFAGEPDVAQPIALDFDDRGRLLVAECFSYPKWSTTGLNRILIFEDADGDGRFDKRTVFKDKLANLTGLAWGFGGVWAICPPNLLFIPDKNGDDVPDGEPVAHLAGFDTKKVGHNMPSCLSWGPDGWLYGLQGIQAQSRIGTPTTPEDQRAEMNCGVWRYHPVRKIFEVVAHGTTNPWGLDFDQYGEAFFTNCVIGHLWHYVPGAHYQRMYGNDFDPHVYGLIASTSDHLHWGGGSWTESRSGKGKHSEAGGGHAHTGALVYQGDNWPGQYRGRIFMWNIHGGRLNCDRLERQGSGYVGRHDKDFLFANDPWFRGIALKTGPDGGVYISDWTDLGECHDNDGVHRTSGRIYKVTYGKPATAGKKIDLAKLDNGQLVGLLHHRNAWHARHARRLLQERQARGDDIRDAIFALSKAAEKQDLTEPQRLQLLWGHVAVGHWQDDDLARLLDDKSERMRAWAVRLIGDNRQVESPVLKKFAKMATDDDSPLVRLYLASVCQRLKTDDRWPIVEGLVTHADDADDHNLPLMIWYAVEPLVPADKARAIKLAGASKIPLVRQYIARRAAEK